MSGTLIGAASWVLRPGGSETPGDDGSVEIVRVYNGSLTGWAAFRDSMPVGTVDPVYGSAAVSTAKPSLVEERNLTGVATVTFVGGLFEPGQTTTPPQIDVKLISHTITEAVDPVFLSLVSITYRAWQTDISYTQKGTPNDAGKFKALARTTSPVFTAEAVTQAPAANHRVLTTAEIAAQVRPYESGGSPDPRLVDIRQSKRSGDGGSQIWEVVESWLMGLEPIP